MFLFMKITRHVSAVSILTLLTFALASTFMVSGCRTMEGAGKDVERAGEKIQENAEKHN